jgi:hypothetical protein
MVVGSLFASSLAFADAPPPAPAAATGAAPPTEIARAEARERFARAVRLFNENDNAAALAEFQRVYDLVPSAVVLYNIGLVYAAMGRPVEAVDALDRLLKNPESLSREQLDRARTTLAAEADRVATLGVRTNVEGATIEVDNLDVSRTPITAPVKLASGTHVVAAVVPGYVPVRKAVSLAGRAQTDIVLELQPMQGQLAHLTLHSDLPGAQVLVDGQVVGETPLGSSLPLAPGKHRVALRRPGYVNVEKNVVLGDGATGDLTIDPEEDPVLTSIDGTVTLALRETSVVVTVDGKLRGPYTAPLHLPAGIHHFRIERAGFFASERDVVVPLGGELTLPVELDPTPDTLASYTRDAKAHKVWGWAGVVAGVVLSGVGVGVLAADASSRGSDKSQYDTLTGQLLAHTGPCNFAAGGQPAQCYVPINAAADSYNSTLTRDALGYTFLGLGVAGLAAGSILLVTAGDPHRYDKQAAAGPSIATFKITPDVVGGPGGGWMGLHGTF